MSYPHSKPISIGDTFSDPSDSLGALEGSRPFIQSADRTIDAALRNVPLPDGMLNRLRRLVYTMSDEAADQVDYLGC
jgi:hypothetical protein